jgi:hypothetical protein
MTTNGTSNAIIFYVSSTTSPAPTIISVFPNMASVGGGSTIIVSGSGFTPDSVVYIGGKHVSKVTIVDSSTIEAITASSSPGTYDVLVSNVNGDAFLPGGFIYSQGSPEKITAVNPAAGTVNIPINTPVSVLFSRSVNRASVTASSLSLVETGSAQPVPGTFSFDFGDSAVMFKPNAYLKPNTSYSISITSDIRSVEGIAGPAFQRILYHR